MSLKFLKNEPSQISKLYESNNSMSQNPVKITEGSLSVQDISGSSTYPNKSLKSNKYFILHHTAGKGNASDIVNILNKRKLGIQYIIDRDAKVYKATKGNKGAHVAYFKNSAPSDMSNSTAQGVEIIASDDTDILIPQCKSALLLIKSLGYSLSSIYGHGEVSTNKMATEGATCKKYVQKYWNTPENELPDSDPSLGKGGSSSTTSTSNTSTTTDSSTTSSTSSNTEGGTFGMIGGGKLMGFLDAIFPNKKKEEKKDEEKDQVNEELDRIKDLIKKVL